VAAFKGELPLHEEYSRCMWPHGYPAWLENQEAEEDARQIELPTTA
jgi:hypothetical protein